MKSSTEVAETAMRVLETQRDQRTAQQLEALRGSIQRLISASERQKEITKEAKHEIDGAKARLNDAIEAPISGQLSKVERGLKETEQLHTIQMRYQDLIDTTAGWAEEKKLVREAIKAARAEVDKQVQEASQMTLPGT